MAIGRNHDDSIRNIKVCVTGRQALAFLCELSAVDMLIVDRDVTPEQAAIIDHAEVRVLLAGLTRDGQAEEEFHA